MPSRVRCVCLIVKSRPDAWSAFGAVAQEKLGLEMRPLFPNADATRALGVGPQGGAWAVAGLQEEACEGLGWEQVHQLALDQLELRAPGAAIHAEPDLLQEYPAFPPRGEPLAARGDGKFDDHDRDFPRGPGFAWL